MGRVLVVDDDPDNLLIVRAVLEGSGHDVAVTREPGEALALLLQAPFEAAVLDVMMPGVSGYDVLSSIRQHPATRELPVLFLSAASDGPERAKGLRHGADDFMGKPFDPDELAVRVSRLILRAEKTRDSGDRLRSALALLHRRMEDGARLPDEVHLGRYHVQEVLGVGGMGTVFRGHDPKLKRPVAIKTIRLDEEMTGYNRADLVKSLLEEAVTVARFSHPHIVSIFDAEDAPEAAFIVMELVDGMSLETALRRHDRLEPWDAVPLAGAVARALGAAHAHGVLHHDVKPANVLLGSGGLIKVSDFGFAGLISSAVKDRAKLFGTPGYLPPEAVAGKGYDERGDLFALGVVLYRCLTGHRLFKGKSQEETMRRTYFDEVEPPSRANREVPLAIDLLVMELLQKDPARRPRSALEVAERLDSLAARYGWRFGLPVPSAPSRDREPSERTSRSCLVPTMLFGAPGDAEDFAAHPS